METLAPEAPNYLQKCIQGTVLTPGDANYDTARMAWNLNVDQHPAVIVIANNVDDVAEAVLFANYEGLGVAVQSTGHGVTLPANDCLLIITSHMNKVRVNAATQTAWVEAGAKWAAVLEKAQAVGLAPLLGSSPDVGVVGYTLGGGAGWLVRKYGLSLDSVRAFEVVTADGYILHCSETENRDLFWALRGGGGSFGVITGMEIQLYPVTTVFGGFLIYPLGMARAIFKQYREWIATLPEEMTSSIAVMNFPPAPDLPEFLRGQSVVMLRACYCGTTKDGEALMRPWMENFPALVNTFREMPFSEVGTISSDPTDPGYGMSVGGNWLRDLDNDTIDILLRYAAPASEPSPLIFIEVRHVGGAMARVEKGTNAFGYRDNSLLMSAVGICPSPEAFARLMQYAAEFKAELKPHMGEGLYMNFVEGKAARDLTKSGYSLETYYRLRTVKAKYDPNNLFRYSYDIAPAEEDER